MSKAFDCVRRAVVSFIKIIHISPVIELIYFYRGRLMNKGFDKKMAFYSLSNEILCHIFGDSQIAVACW